MNLRIASIWQEVLESLRNGWNLGLDIPRAKPDISTMKNIRPVSYLVSIAMFVFGALTLQSQTNGTNLPPVLPPEGVPADLIGWVSLIIAGLTPIVIAGIKFLAPKAPKITWPFVALFIGLLLQWVSTFATGHDAQPVIGLIAGAIGVWLREAVDQIGKLGSTPVTTIPE